MAAPPTIAQDTSALPQPTSAELPLDVYPTAYGTEQVRQLRIHAHQNLRRGESKRLAPSTISGVQDVLQAVYAPLECCPVGTPYVVAALPGGVISIMNTNHLQKSYLFYEEPPTPSTSSKKDRSRDDKKSSKPSEPAPPRLSKEEEKERERRRNLNTIAVFAFVPPPAQAATQPQQWSRNMGRGHNNSTRSNVPTASPVSLVSSVLDNHIILFPITDFGARTQTVTAANVTKVLPLPAGSWKRVTLAFSPTGEHLLVALRPSGSHTSQNSQFAVLSRPTSAAVSKDTLASSFACSGGWVEGPPQMVFCGWLDTHQFVTVGKSGNVQTYNTSASIAMASSQVLPIGGMQVTAAGLLPLPQYAAGPWSAGGSAMLYAVLDGTVLHAFEMHWSRKRGREDASSLSDTAPMLIPFHSTLSPGGFAIQSVAPITVMQQPVVLCTLETGAVLLYHGLHLERLYHNAYQRRCKDSATTRLCITTKERPLQIAVYEDETLTVLKA